MKAQWVSVRSDAGILHVMRTFRLFALIGILTLAAACGQKGSLVLPDAQHPRKKIALPKTAAAPVSRSTALKNSGDAEADRLPPP